MMRVFNTNELYFDNIRLLKRNKVSYLDISASFDIEVSSFIEDDKKYACMYLFGVGVNGKCILGRTYDDLIRIFTDLVNYYSLSESKRLIIYVHNLSYEWQFIRKHFEVKEVFSIDERKPIYAVLKCGIELRCSYLLSGYKLEKVGEHLNKYKVNKLDGSIFNYDKLRTPVTKLDDYEIEYILHDNYVVMCYIQELIEELDGITKIPYTKTAFVRKLLKNNCLYDGDKSHRINGYKYTQYRDLMKRLVIQSVGEYKQLKRAFLGGFTHASNRKVFNIYQNVSSNDFTSSYPYVLVSEMFPMSKSKIVYPKSIKELEHYIDCYCCLFDVKFTGLEDIFHYEHYLSQSKCDIIGEGYNDNGRVVYADELYTTITDVDYRIIKKCYKWDKLQISNFRIYERGYLPKTIIKSILELYQKKTELKGVDGMEVEYMRSKENINSVYGCMVTDIARCDIKYENDSWQPIVELTADELKDKLETYNNTRNRVLFYPWGVWCTAYARYNLWTAIFEYKDDYIYCDTDSIKGLNYDKHQEYHKRYNELVRYKLESMCNTLNFDFSLCSPKTIKGKIKTLGEWDFEGIYNIGFKTLGAKRYGYITDDGLSLTISGLNKIYAVPYLCDGWCCEIKSHKMNFNPLDKFKDGMYVPPDSTGKLTHTYIDDRYTKEVIDYQGNKCIVDEYSYIHLSKQDFNLSISRSFLDYVMTFRTDEIL